MAQSLPTSQPNYLQIYREEVKVGRAADHEKVEAGWPAAYEKAKSPYTYIALTSMTGPGEAWFISPFESHAAMGDSMKREDEPSLAAALGRLQRADGDGQQLPFDLGEGRKDLSYGAYPETAKQRFYEITIFRVRPATSRLSRLRRRPTARRPSGGPDTSYRVYEVMAGMPSPTYSSSRRRLPTARSTRRHGRPGDDEGRDLRGAHTLKKFMADGVINTETIRFRLNPTMSYVTQDVRATDAAFWRPKPATALAPRSRRPKPDVKPASQPKK